MVNRASSSYSEDGHKTTLTEPVYVLGLVLFRFLVNADLLLLSKYYLHKQNVETAPRLAIITSNKESTTNVSLLNDQQLINIT